MRPRAFSVALTGLGDGAVYIAALSPCRDHTDIIKLVPQVFLWIGAEANATEKEGALSTAQEYLVTHPSGRDPDTPILIIKQGFEPPTFTGWFLAWDPHMWSVRNWGCRSDCQGAQNPGRGLGTDSRAK